MSPLTLMMLLSALGLGTTITFSSSHWLLAWMGLEMNTLAIIPLMAKSFHPRAVEASTKYFITQAAAAALILFAATTDAWSTGQWLTHQLSSPSAAAMVTLALSLKLGLAPLHFWLPEVLQGLDLLTCLLLSTWQKLAPLALLLQVPSPAPNIIIFLALSSMLVGGWGGLNQTQLRKVLAYSSIAHLGWMLVVIQFLPALTLLSLVLYIIMTSATFLVMHTNATTSVASLSTSWSKSPCITAMFPLIVLSLGGLPPLSGFMPKWLILQELSKQHLPTVATLSALSALLSLYFYLRLSYSMTLTTSPSTPNSSAPWRFPCLTLPAPLAITVSLAGLLLPLTPSVLALFA
uniref:NADH-ubiquinone oxidoreductase chain 2 n=1 Tax=Trachinocephalus myops TaxID=172131 RepID=A0A1B0V2G7_TRAMY|nr:NADH dehydrogenase subunit 2 [Trachinocephalus myops]